MRVIATKNGFYGGALRRAGEAFELTSARHFSPRWMDWSEDRRQTTEDRPERAGPLTSDVCPLTSDNALKRAVAELNHDLGIHWTRAGKPDLGHLSRTLGRKVTRAQVEAAAPGLRRRPRPV